MTSIYSFKLIYFSSNFVKTNCKEMYKKFSIEQNPLHPLHVCYFNRRCSMDQTTKPRSTFLLSTPKQKRIPFPPPLGSKTQRGRLPAHELSKQKRRFRHNNRGRKSDRPVGWRRRGRMGGLGVKKRGHPFVSARTFDSFIVSPPPPPPPPSYPLVLCVIGSPVCV